VEAEIFDFIGLRKLNIIDFNWWAGRTPCSEGDVGRLGFIGFHPLSFGVHIHSANGVKLLEA
jgi:hypothetical protein